MQEVDTWNDPQAGQLRDPAGRGLGEAERGGWWDAGGWAVGLCVDGATAAGWGSPDPAGPGCVLFSADTRARRPPVLLRGQGCRRLGRPAWEHGHLPLPQRGDHTQSW